MVRVDRARVTNNSETSLLNTRKCVGLYIYIHAITYIHTYIYTYIHTYMLVHTHYVLLQNFLKIVCTEINYLL
jgi:hypothetical protein